METGLSVKNMQHHFQSLMFLEQIRSGLGIREWCSQNSINPKTFYALFLCIQLAVLLIKVELNNSSIASSLSPKVNNAHATTIEYVLHFLG